MRLGSRTTAGQYSNDEHGGILIAPFVPAKAGTHWGNLLISNR